jgi:hypothetical protein
MLFGPSPWWDFVLLVLLTALLLFWAWDSWRYGVRR